MVTVADTTIKQKLDKEIATIFRHSAIDKKFYTSKGNVTYADFLSNRMLMIRKGVPYSLFNLIQHSLVSKRSRF